MVCRECGAYNAEHLTHCRVCAAKLRDADASAISADSQLDANPAQEDAARPAREFVSAPSWPTRAFSGASEPTAYTAPSAQPVQAQASYTPLSSAGGINTTVSQQPQLSTCPNCGKPALPDAPFCPYCGQPLGTAAAAPAARPVSAQVAAAQAPVAQARKAAPVKRAAAVDDFDDEDDFDDDDFDDDEPRKKKGKPAPKSKAKKGKAARRDDDFDDDDEFDDDDDFDDDDEFDDDDDFDDLPKKRGKGTTLLFWGLIALLVVLIAAFGIYIVNKNFDGDAGKMFASITSAFGSKKDPESDTPAEGDPAALSAEEPVDLMNTATLTEYTDPTSGELYYDVNIYAATGSTIRIITDAELDGGDTAVVPSNDHVVLRIARDVFMPNKPCDSETVTITPNIQVDTPTGETIQLAVDDITVTVPSITLTLTDPATETYKQTYENPPIVVSGTVDDHTVEVYVNGEKLTVYDGGVFTTTYQPKRAVATTAAVSATPATDTPAADAAATDAAATDAAATDATDTDAAAADDAAADAAPATAADTAATDAADDAAATDATPEADAGLTATAGAGNYPTDDQGRETITVEARKNNYVTVRKVIVIEPFVMQNTTVNVTNVIKTTTIKDNGPANSVRAVDGVVTLTGTVTPGASVSASCDDGTGLTFGEPTVSETGAFSLAVNVPQTGVFDVSLTAKMEGAYESTVDTFVERAPEDLTPYDKKCKKLSTDYDKIIAGDITSGDYKDSSAKVTEVISTGDVTLYKMDIGSGKIIVCAQRSVASVKTYSVGDKKQIWGTLKGLYTDGTPYLWTWFIKNN